jgi:hypothetical protein
MLGEKRLYETAVDSIDFSQQRDSLLLGQCLRTAERLVWMLLEHPDAELSPNVRFTDAFNDFDAGIAQDERTRAVDTRVRVAHTDHDSGDTALCDGSGACGGAAVEGARLEGGVKGCADHNVSARLSVARSGDLRVIVTWAKSVTASSELPTRADDGAADPRVVTGSPACELRLFDRQAHPSLVLAGHRSAA